MDVTFVEQPFDFIWLGSNRQLVLMVLRCHIEYTGSLCVFCLINTPSVRPFSPNVLLYFLQSKCTTAEAFCWDDSYSNFR